DRNHMNTPRWMTRTLAVIAIVGLTACSSSTPTSQGGDAADETVTICYADVISNGGNDKSLQTTDDAFADANPDTTVDVTTTGSANICTQLQTDPAAGTEPDVFDGDAGAFASIQASGVLAPLQGFDAAAYRQGVLESSAVDGAQYGLP